MKKIYYGSFFMLLFLLPGFNNSFSQPYKVSGSVTNAETGDKVYDAIITLQPGTKSAKSDNNGFYEIRDIASGDYKLICSYPGLK